MSYRSVLVTGGAGFVGSHLADRLLEQGLHVAVVDDFSSGRRMHLDSKVSVHQLDIGAAELADVFREEKPQVVFHLAAQASVSRSVADPEEDARVNVMGTLNLLRMCSRFGVHRFVYSSTGGALYGNPVQLPCSETHAIRPVSPYGASKHAAESYVHAYGSSAGFKYTILRPSNVYGPRQDPYGEAGVIAIFTQLMLENKEVTIFGSGEQERDFVYVGDVVEANLKALEQETNEEYNLGAGCGTTINAVFDMLAEATGYKERPVHVPPREGDVFKISLDNRKAEHLLGWSPRVDLAAGLKLTVDYYRNHGR